VRKIFNRFERGTARHGFADACDSKPFKPWRGIGCQPDIKHGILTG
jgi:hypothetical protein